MEFIEDDMRDSFQTLYVLDEEYFEKSRGHQGDFRFGIDYHIPGNDPHPFRTMESFKFFELLIGKGFDRSGIDNPITFGDGLID